MILAYTLSTFPVVICVKKQRLSFTISMNQWHSIGLKVFHNISLTCTWWCCKCIEKRQESTYRDGSGGVWHLKSLKILTELTDPLKYCLVIDVHESNLSMHKNCIKTLDKLIAKRVSTEGLAPSCTGTFEVTCMTYMLATLYQSYNPLRTKHKHIFTFCVISPHW